MLAIRKRLSKAAFISTNRILLLESKADFCCWSKAVYYAACEVSKVNLGRQRVEA